MNWFLFPKPSIEKFSNNPDSEGNENVFNQLESESKNDTDITNSLQNQPTAIEKRQESETLMSDKDQFWKNQIKS